MEMTVHRGLSEVGGNIVEVATESTRILLDAGEELEGYDNPVDFATLLERRRFDAVFVSHYHGDHAGLLSAPADETAPSAALPPVYMGEIAFEVFRRCSNRMRRKPSFAPVGFLAHGRPVHVGDITVTPIRADHSAIDSYSLLVEAGGKSLLYTGDFRSTGRMSFSSYLESLPEEVDILVTEGTTLSRPGYRANSEQDVEDELAREIAGCSGKVFVLAASTNLDRMVSAYNAARRCGLPLLQDTYQAELALACAPERVPNPIDCPDVFAYTPCRLGEAEHEAAAALLGDKFIGRRRVSAMRAVVCVRCSGPMLRNLRALNELSPLDGSVLAYSMWDGYKQKEGMRAFIDAAESMGMRVVDIHAGGHADEDAIRAVIARVKPGRVVPIHTDNAAWFSSEHPQLVSVTSSNRWEF